MGNFLTFRMTVFKRYGSHTAKTYHSLILTDQFYNQIITISPTLTQQHMKFRKLIC
jgi:hypothetical protein